MNKTEFEAEKAKLHKEAVAGFNRLNSNLQVLNRQMEIVHSIGAQLEEPAKAWANFQQALAPISIAKQPEVDKTNEDPFARSSSTPRSMGEEQRIG